MYKIETEEFSGPLEKLLELIEIKKLDITKISLAKVTAGFLDFVKKLEKDIDSGDKTFKKNEKLILLVDFLYVATRLILIKAKSLMPNIDISEDEEGEMEELEKRIAIYKKMKSLFNEFEKIWNTSGRLFSRNKTLYSNVVFYPDNKITKQSLESSIKSVFGSIAPFVSEHKNIEQQKISMKKMVERISTAIKNSTIKFSEIISKSSKEESIVAFLAVLHLLRDGLLVADQMLEFGEIKIQKIKK